MEGADGPAASHEAQHELEAEHERERLKEMGVEVEEETSSEPAALSAAAVAGEAVYKQACFACHGTGVAGAPKIGDKSAWEPRIAKGMDTLVSHAINGFQGESGVMPAKGGRADLSDEQVSNAVAFMSESSQ
jgi:cytochrome c